jgi:hypothetical protein
MEHTKKPSNIEMFVFNLNRKSSIHTSMAVPKPNNKNQFGENSSNFKDQTQSSKTFPIATNEA